jgi:hypothetical protein
MYGIALHIFPSTRTSISNAKVCRGHWNGTGWQLALDYLGTGTGALMNFGHACLVELVDHFSSQRLGIQGVESRSNTGNMFYHFLVQEVLQVPYQALILSLKN